MAARRTALAHDPAVSVVIPTFNRADLLPRAIGSVLAQSMTRLELIVVDDASEDATPAVLSGISDRRLRVFRQDRNGGVAAARNRGIAQARAPLVAFLDSDDTWLPAKLDRQVAALRDATCDTGMICTGVETLLQDGGRETFGLAPDGAAFQTLLARNVLHGAPSTAMVRREVFDMVGGFDESLPAIEDYEMWLRVARFWRIETLPEPLARYHDTAAAGRRSRDAGANLRARAALHALYRDDLRRAGLERAFLYDSARRMWRAGGRHRLGVPAALAHWAAPDVADGRILRRLASAAPRRLRVAQA